MYRIDLYIKKKILTQIKFLKKGILFPKHAKIKREKDEIPTITLVKNPDIAADLGKMKTPGQKLIGFALETNDEEANAQAKLAKKNLDAIVLNSLRDKDACFGTDTNKITIFFANGNNKQYPLKPKAEVAKDIIDSII